MRRDKTGSGNPEPETDITGCLPGKITSLNTQTRNPSRVSVFIDDVFRFGCYKTVALDSGLSVGLTLTAETYHRLARAEERFKLREYMIGLLARRAHTSVELRRKALKKDLPEEQIDDVIQELKDKKFIDEAAYARSYARQTYQNKRWGPARIKQELLKRGVDHKTAEAVLDEIITDNPAKVLEELVIKYRKRFRRESDIFRRRKKIFDHLSRKGHSPTVILDHMDALTKLVDRDE